MADFGIKTTPEGIDVRTASADEVTFDSGRLNTTVAKIQTANEAYTSTIWMSNNPDGSPAFTTYYGWGKTPDDTRVRLFSDYMNEASNNILMTDTFVTGINSTALIDGQQLITLNNDMAVPFTSNASFATKILRLRGGKKDYGFQLARTGKDLRNIRGPEDFAVNSSFAYQSIRAIRTIPNTVITLNNITAEILLPEDVLSGYDRLSAVQVLSYGRYYSKDPDITVPWTTAIPSSQFITIASEGIIKNRGGVWSYRTGNLEGLDVAWIPTYLTIIVWVRPAIGGNEDVENINDDIVFM